MAILLAATAVATIMAIQERRIVSPIVTKVLELIERVLFVVPVPLVIVAMDLFSKVRAH